jgi:hypothetical protein
MWWHRRSRSITVASRARRGTRMKRVSGVAYIDLGALAALSPA